MSIFFNVFFVLIVFIVSFVVLIIICLCFLFVLLIFFVKKSVFFGFFVKSKFVVGFVGFKWLIVFSCGVKLKLIVFFVVFFNFKLVFLVNIESLRFVDLCNWCNLSWISKWFLFVKEIKFVIVLIVIKLSNFFGFFLSNVCDNL